MRRALPLFAMTVIAMAQAGAVWAADQYEPAIGDNANPAFPQLLTWPGKAPPAPQADAGKPQAPPIQAASRAPTSLYDTPPARWRANAEAAPAPQSSSLAASAPTEKGAPPHFYSVARQYGVQPDPVQLSAQFLASTPQSDMAEPPPLPPPHTAGPQSANMSTAAATNQVRQAQEAAADADAAALGN